jgi:hypothetical protein
LAGGGTGFLTGAGGAAGATIGGLKGLFSDPGEDEEGNRKSRIMAALKGGLGGGALGAAGGLAAGAGGLAGLLGGGKLGLRAGEELGKRFGTKQAYAPMPGAAQRLGQMAARTSGQPAFPPNSAPASGPAPAPPRKPYRPSGAPGVEGEFGIRHNLAPTPQAGTGWRWGPPKRPAGSYFPGVPGSLIPETGPAR